MTLQNPDGIPLGWHSCATPGNGTMELGAVVDTGHQDLAVFSGRTVTYHRRDGIRYEIGYGTITVSGPLVLVTRDPRYSSNGNGLVEWPAAPSDVFVVLLPDDIVLLNRARNIYHTGAVQDFNGNDLIYSPDDLIKQVTTNSLWALQLGLTSTAGQQITADKTGTVTIEHRDGGSAASGGLRLVRNSSSAEDADGGYGTAYGFMNDAGDIEDFIRFRPVALDVSDGTEDGQLIVEIKVNGSWVAFQTMSGTALIVPSSVNVLIGKSSASYTTQGCEFRGDGTASIIAGAAQPFNLGRNNDGAIVDIRVGGAVVGTISVASGVVTYGTFSGAHISRWATGFEEDRDPPLGAILCRVDEAYSGVDGLFERLPCVRLSAKRGEKGCYGQFGGWELRESEMDNDEIERLRGDKARWRDVLAVEPIQLNKADVRRERREWREPVARSLVRWRRMQVWGLGTSPSGIPVQGPCEAFEAVMTSDVPGVACYAPEGTDFRRLIGIIGESVPAGAIKWAQRSTVHCG